MVYGSHTVVKMTFEVPDAIAKAFKSSVPAGMRSKFVADAMRTKATHEEAELRKLCERVNRSKKLAAEAKEWDTLQDGDA